MKSFFSGKIRRFSLMLFSVLIPNLAMMHLALADSYPNRPITIVVPFAPGGGVDVIARVLAESLDRKLGQRVIVENVPGATGMIGAARVARAAPDGYTILFNNISQATINTFGENVPYDARTDFSPIGSIAYMPMLLVNRTSLEPKDPRALIQAIRSKPREFTVGTNGVGSTTYLCQAQFQKSIGAVGMVEIPYKGTGPTMIDLAGGALDLACDTMLGAGELIKAGRISPLAVAAPARFATLPNVPTLAELGVPGMNVSVWFAAFGPKGLPDTIAETLAAAIRDIIAEPTVIAKLAALNAQPEPASEVSPVSLGARMRNETERWASIAPRPSK